MCNLLLLGASTNWRATASLIVPRHLPFTARMGYRTMLSLFFAWGGENGGVSSVVNRQKCQCQLGFTVVSSMASLKLKFVRFSQVFFSSRLGKNIQNLVWNGGLIWGFPPGCLCAQDLSPRSCCRRWGKNSRQKIQPYFFDGWLNLSRFQGFGPKSHLG